MSQKKQPEKNISSLPSSGGTGSVSGIGSVSSTDRVAQVRALQSLSPFTALNADVKVSVEKGFDLDGGAFNVRASALQRMNEAVTKITEKSKFKIFNQHVEGVTFFKEGQEHARHTISQANTGLFSLPQALELQGGTYDNPRIFKPQQQKGSVE